MVLAMNRWDLSPPAVDAPPLRAEKHDLSSRFVSQLSPSTSLTQRAHAKRTLRQMLNAFLCNELRDLLFSAPQRQRRRLAPYNRG
eukprot:scaffold38150_cov65-Phaeocystis_antarctica.AAC.26